MDLDLLCTKKNYGKNRRVSLQDLRKKWYEKQLKYVDCAVETTRFACKNKEMIEVKDLMKRITLADRSGNPYVSIKQEVEFDESERLVKLETLKKSLNEGLLEAIRLEDRVHQSPALSSTSLSDPGFVEEDEDDLEYLRRWASE